MDRIEDERDGGVMYRHRDQHRGCSVFLILYLLASPSFAAYHGSQI
jgi:hypothetical protein